MQRFRKVIASRACVQVAAAFRNPVKIARFSTYTTDSAGVPQEQPKDDGFVYFRNNEEIERDEIMNAQFERMLNCADSSEERQRLVLLLGNINLKNKSIINIAMHAFSNLHSVTPLNSISIFPIRSRTNGAKIIQREKLDV